jgi:hypothetical protein
MLLACCMQWVVRTLLEEGFSVRGAVRSATKGTHLVEQFAAYGDKFELAIVPDITKVMCVVPSLGLRSFRFSAH